MACSVKSPVFFWVFFSCDLNDAIQPVLGRADIDPEYQGSEFQIFQLAPGGSMMEEIWLTTSNVEKHI